MDGDYQGQQILESASSGRKSDSLMLRVAILVDGGFYRKRAYNLFGDKTPEERSKELVTYCKRHLSGTSRQESNYLYRIFYYDCPPLSKVVYNPLTQGTVDLSKSTVHSWMEAFLDALAHNRKVALRLGELQESEIGYRLREKPTKKLLRGDIQISDLTQKDFELNVVQKGVDMRIGLDIASLAQKRLVDQVVLISGDSDFVPAAKYARREGIDFVLDPMWQSIRPSLMRHIDGLHSCTPKVPTPSNDRLCIKDSAR